MSIWNSMMLGTAVGAAGTCLGALIALLLKKTNRCLPYLLMSFSGGIMLSIVFFDMIIEAYGYSNLITTAVSLLLGGLFVGLLQKKQKERTGGNNMKIMGVLMASGIALHNFPEGLAVGSSLAASSYGISLSILLLFHNVPEGMAMALPLKMGGVKGGKIILLSLAAGMPTALGAFLGRLIGDISKQFIGACIGFAAGAMLYLTVRELLPETFAENNISKNVISMGLGIVTGVLMVLLI